MKAAIALALVVAVAGGCGQSQPAETTKKNSSLTASQLVVHWWYEAKYGTKNIKGEVTVASASDRATALSTAQTKKNTMCASDQTCKQEAVIGFMVDLCLPGWTAPCSTAVAAEQVTWVGVIDRMGAENTAQLAFLESQNFQAEGIQFTLQKQKDALGVLRLAAESSITNTRTKIINDAHARLQQMGSAATSAEQVKLAETRRIVTALEKITAEYQTDLDQLQAPYGDIAARHLAHRQTETQSFTSLKDLATSASTSGLSQLSSLKIQLATISNSENRTPQLLILDAKRLAWDFAKIQAKYQNALLPYTAFMTEKGWQVLDHTSAPRAGVLKVVDYAEGRMRRVNDAVSTIYDGIRRREAALVLAATDTATRDQLRVADGAQRESEFLSEITTRATELWKVPPNSALGLPLQGERFSAMTAFRQLEGICKDLTQMATWRAPGCQKVASEASKVRTYLTTTLPFTLKYGVQKMRAAGFDNSVLIEIETRVAAGDLAQAVHIYDATLRAAEEG